MNYLKYMLAKTMVKRSRKNSDFDPVAAEKDISVDTSIPDYNNSYYFTGHSWKGEAVMIRVAGRSSGEYEIWFSFHIPGKGNFSISPDVQKKVSSFEESPVKLACLEPQKRWNIAFSGAVDGEQGPAEVDFDVELTSEYPIFHYTNDMDPSAHARAMAEHRWTKEWFLKLQKMHQHHYEQGGDMKGHLTLNGERHGLDMRYVRDHSFGPRTWGNLDRHLWLTACLENGDFCNVSIPEYPFFKMTAGFYASGGSYRSVIGAPPFTGIAPDRIPDETFSYFMKLDNGRKLEASCSRGPGFTWLMGGAYKVIEWASEFEIGGVRGRGICEMGFNLEKFPYGGI